MGLSWELCSFPEWKWEEWKDGRREKRKKMFIKQLLHAKESSEHFRDKNSFHLGDQKIDLHKLTENWRKLDWLLRKKSTIYFLDQRTLVGRACPKLHTKSTLNLRLDQSTGFPSAPSPYLHPTPKWASLLCVLLIHWCLAPDHIPAEICSCQDSAPISSDKCHQSESRVPLVTLDHRELWWVPSLIF